MPARYADGRRLCDYPKCGHFSYYSLGEDRFCGDHFKIRKDEIKKDQELDELCEVDIASHFFAGR